MKITSLKLLKIAKIDRSQKNGNIKQKQQQKTQQQHKKSSKISLRTHPSFLTDFLHAVYLFQCLKTCFARII